jgi:RimJ/RimL family protein N-acetyltransferase
MLKGENVVVTHLREEDRVALFVWMNDAGTVRFNAPWSPLDWRSHCRWFDELGQDRSRVIFAIRRAPDAEVLGTVQLRDIHPVHRSAELTIRIGVEAERGKGAGKEALRLAIRFAFDDLNLRRVDLRVFASNERAIRAYRAAGFGVEGTMRRAAYIGGRWEDVLMMAVLREDDE